MKCPKCGSKLIYLVYCKKRCNECLDPDSCEEREVEVIKFCPECEARKKMEAMKKEGILYG